MAPIDPVPLEQATAEVTPVYAQVAKRFGRVPDFFATLAHRPNVLKHFPPGTARDTAPAALGGGTLAATERRGVR